MLIKAHDAPAFALRAAGFLVRLLQLIQGHANLLDGQSDFLCYSPRMHVNDASFVAVR
jgi:hypothetical protein